MRGLTSRLFSSVQLTTGHFPHSGPANPQMAVAPLLHPRARHQTLLYRRRVAGHAHLQRHCPHLRGGSDLIVSPARIPDRIIDRLRDVCWSASPSRSPHPRPAAVPEIPPFPRPKFASRTISCQPRARHSSFLQRLPPSTCPGGPLPAQPCRRQSNAQPDRRASASSSSISAPGAGSYWLYRCDEITSVRTDFNPRASRLASGVKSLKKADLYFWVEYEIDGCPPRLPSIYPLPYLLGLRMRQ